MELSRIVHGEEGWEPCQKGLKNSIRNSPQEQVKNCLTSARHVNFSLSIGNDSSGSRTFRLQSLSERPVYTSQIIQENKAETGPNGAINKMQNTVLHCGIKERLFYLSTNEKKELYEILLNLRIAKGNTYCCEVCERRFRRKSDLSRHLCMHFNIRPHVCNICSKSFVQKGSLNTHTLRHK